MAMEQRKVLSMGVGTISKEIDNFLKNKGYKSENTRESYKREISRFFELIKHKQIDFLTRDDVQVTFDELEYFVNYLVEYKDNMSNKKFNNKTINHHVSAIAELLRYLNMKKIVDDISCLSAIKMIRLPENDNEYGVLTVDEVFDFANWVRENEVKMADTKYYFIILSLATCLRKGAILNLKWENFIVQDDHVLIKAIDKGNKDFRKKISFNFYNEILQLKDKYKSEKVFKIGATTLQEMLDRWKEYRDIKENRNIVIHSIRKAGATHLWKTTKNIMDVKDMLGHSSPNTTIKYIGKEDSVVIDPINYRDNVDQDLYKKVSKEDLIKAIEGLVGCSTLINLKLNEIVNQKNI